MASTTQEDIYPNLHLLTHPILRSKLALLRSKDTKPMEFRRLVGEVTTLIGVEALRGVEVEEVKLETPLAPFTGVQVKPRIGLTPILRAGLGMTDAMLSLLPEAPVFHLGLFRDSHTLLPVEYYQKLPATPTVDTILIIDPMLATGGTAVAAVNMLRDWGLPIESIKLLCIVASMPGLQKVIDACGSGLEIWVGGIDRELTPNGMIMPGLGDSGDRLFSTTRNH